MKRNILLLVLLANLAVTVSAEVSHWVAPVYNFTRINTQTLNQYDFHSAGIRYALLTDKEFGFLGAAGLYLPIAYNNNGDSGSVFDSYNIPLNFDVLLGVGSTISVELDNEFSAGLGVYLQGIFLNHTDYERYYFDSLTAGFGADFAYHFIVNEKYNLGAGVMTGFNFIDLLHKGPDRLLNGITFNTSILVGF
ncbi:MAG: hypothetical protein PQJ58_06200 [Spirochaetales bacterium]|nr:hypothetical protein [Spirochaetales bacterium]